MNEASTFTKIINGDIPGERIYEDDHCVVLMTIEPITPGHCLVIPREQIDHLWDVTDDLYTHLMSVAKKVALALRGTYEYPRIGEFVEGFGVPHAHIHVLGLTQGLERLIPEYSERKRTASPEELAAEGTKIRSHLVD